MPKYTRYWHHGERVWVRKDLKGRHREHCLCYSCFFFYPDQPGNCHIAESVHHLCKAFDLTLPVWECPMFREKEEELCSSD